MVSDSLSLSEVSIHCIMSFTKLNSLEFYDGGSKSQYSSNLF